MSLSLHRPHHRGDNDAMKIRFSCPPDLYDLLPQPQLARKLRRRALGGLASFVLAGIGLAVLITARFGL